MLGYCMAGRAVQWSLLTNISYSSAAEVYSTSRPSLSLVPFSQQVELFQQLKTDDLGFTREIVERNVAVLQKQFAQASHVGV